MAHLFADFALNIGNHTVQFSAKRSSVSLEHDTLPLPSLRSFRQIAASAHFFIVIGEMLTSTLSKITPLWVVIAVICGNVTLTAANISMLRTSLFKNASRLIVLVSSIPLNAHSTHFSKQPPKTMQLLVHLKGKLAGFGTVTIDPRSFRPIILCRWKIACFVSERNSVITC